MPTDYRKAQKILSPLLLPLSKGYGALMRARAWAYATGLKSSNRPEAFCISVGNISWGGTGKTPLTGWLLDWAKQDGLKAVVLTRGYGGKTDRRPLLVTPCTAPEESGDEPLMLCRAHPEAAILADPDRRRARAWAEKNLCPDLYILDDGMQHLAIQRDLNLVTLSMKDFIQDWNRVIPAGTWREGSSALRRADAFMLRATPEELEKLPKEKLEQLRYYGVPLFAFDLEPTGLAPLRPRKKTCAGNAGLPEGKAHSDSSAEQVVPETVPGRLTATTASANTEEMASNDDFAPEIADALLSGELEYALCTAVGTPESVRRSSVTATGKEPGAEFIFSDHHPYSPEDLAGMSETLRKLVPKGDKLPPILTTAKDAVKLEPHLAGFPQLRFFALESRVEFTGALFTGQSFPDWLGQKKSGPRSAP